MAFSSDFSAVFQQVRSRLCSRLPFVSTENKPSGTGTERSGGNIPSAFAAESTEAGAVVVRVVKDTAAVWPQEEYGRFETWTQAQDFANLLNQSNGMDMVEARYIVVSARLAAQSRDEKS